MFVGVLRLTLHLPSPGSLKSKRHLVRSAIDRVKAKFNVSIAEVAENDLWQRSVLGVTAVANDHAVVNETLADAPQTVNEQPFGAGWLFRLKPDNAADRDALMSAADYEKAIEG